MKKIIKNPIFTFILGALIFGGIVGVSAYTIFANDIGYTPKDSTWKKSNGEDITNVKDAIDELYSKANTSKNLERGSINVTFNSSNWSSINIDFENEFKSVPEVYYEYKAGNSGGSVDVTNITTKGCTIRYVTFFGHTKSDTINWIAIGD